jgi:hypothetical protein
MPATTMTAPRMVWNMPAFFAPSITAQYGYHCRRQLLEVLHAYVAFPRNTANVMPFFLAFIR